MRALGVAKAGEWSAAVDRVALSYDARLLRRRRVETSAGAAVLVDLPQTVGLEHGDALVLEDGGFVEICAAEEELLEVSGAGLHRLAWHIGNRHAPCQIEDARLLIQRDKVLRRMLEGLGATLRDVVEPFTPEGGAYGHGRTMGHSHGDIHGQGHDHHHSHDHDHSHSHEH